MFYEGKIEILDRGDAPALEVLDKNARSLAQRAADETKDELKKVLTRVDNIYDSFEMCNALENSVNSNLEYVDSIQELEDILRDTIKKQKYKQQVTIFIVGYQDVCHQKLTLLQQVNEFFMANCKSIENEDWFPTTPDIDLEEVSVKVEDSLAMAEELTVRLGEINKEMVNYLTNYALNKGNHKAKKKVEKSLQQAKEDVTVLSEKLLTVQTELEEKEEKVVSLMKQAETKHMEIQRYKTAAEVAKKNIKDTEGMKEELQRRDGRLAEQNKKIDNLELELAEIKNSKEKTDERLNNFGQDNLQKIDQLKQQVEEKQLALEEARRDLEKLHAMQILSLQDAHQVEIEELQTNHAEEIKKLLPWGLHETLWKTDEIGDYQEQLEVITAAEGDRAGAVTTTTVQSADNRDDQSVSSKTSSKDKKNRSRSKRSKSRSKSRETRTTKDSNRSRSQGSLNSKKSGATSSKQSGKSGSKGKSEASESPVKVYAEVAVQDEGGNPDVATVSSHLLQSVRENSADFDDCYDLDDEQAWSGVPAQHTGGRFMQYRELAKKRLSELEGQLSATMSKTQRKVETLKSQFKEHKTKWDAERHVLVQQIEQSMKLQSEAENEADTAMTHLETFIIEQEKLENLEDQKQLEFSRTTTRSAEEAQAELAVKSATPDQLGASQSQAGSATIRGDNSTSPVEITVHPEIHEDLPQNASRASEKNSEHTHEQTDEHMDADRRKSEGEPELTKLLLQTDDAKVQLKRSATTIMSGAPTIETPGLEGKKRSQSAQTLSSKDLSLADSPSEEVLLKSAAGFPFNMDASTQWDRSDFTSRMSESYDDAQSQEATPLSTLLGSNEEDFRGLMSKSRACLRSQYKIRLDETKLAIDDRRSRSPAVSIPSLHSLEDDQLIDIDDDLDFVLADDEDKDSKSQTEEKGTSPPSARRYQQNSAGVQSTPTAKSSAQSRSQTKSQTPVQGQLPKISHTPAPQTPMIVEVPPTEIDGLNLEKELKGDHPVVQEYLKSYDGIVNFKDSLAKLLLDKDMMSGSQVLSEMEMLLFNKDGSVLPQLESLTENSKYVLDELISVLETLLVNDRETMLSSLVGVSRDATQTNLISREKSEDSGRGLTGTRVSTRSRSAVSRHSHKSVTPAETEAMIEMKIMCARLQRQQQTDSRKYEEQLRHNTVLMMEMQNTITSLKREISELGKTEKEIQEVPAEPSIMFTRLDSERNAKIMKRALFEDRLDTDKYKEAVNQMDQYVSLPAQRLTQLVRKYIHHRQMKHIEDNVRHSKSLNDNVFNILDKMETLQNKRARQWTDKMDALGVERYRLATLLMDTIDNIEQESGIFLIKPIYSFKGREIKEKPAKLARNQKPPHEGGSPTRGMCHSAVAPAPTPVTGTRPTTRASYNGRVMNIQSETSLFTRSQQPDQSSGVTGFGMVWPSGQPRAVWNMSSSQAKEFSDENLFNYASQNFNTPRILELDINRMMIGQNNVSARVKGGLTDDRLLNASNNSVRSYVTVNRPTVAPGQGRFHEGMVPPSTPHRPSSVQEGVNHRSERRRRIPSSPPLPPISLSQGPSSVKITDARSFSEHSFPPQSPPGSSLRFTPPLHDIELLSA